MWSQDDQILRSSGASQEKYCGMKSVYCDEDGFCRILNHDLGKHFSQSMGMIMKAEQSFALSLPRTRQRTQTIIQCGPLALLQPIFQGNRWS